MTQTKAGAQKAKQTMYRIYGEDYYQVIGQKGGMMSTTGGFAYLKRTGQTDKIREWGRKGGKAKKSWYERLFG